MTEEDEQLKLANGIVNLGVHVWFGAELDDNGPQKMEFGEFFDRIKYYQCDKHGLDKEGDDTCEKLQRKYPAWKFEDRIYVGVLDRKTMTQLLKQENALAKQKKAKSGLL